MARRRAKFEIESMGLDHTKTYTLSELKKPVPAATQDVVVEQQIEQITIAAPVVTTVEQPLTVIEQEEQKPVEKKLPKQKKVKGDVLQAV